MMDNTSSGFETDGFIGIEQQFTDIRIERQTSHNILARARRHGRWWLLKGLLPEETGMPVYQEMLRKEYEMLMRAQHTGIVAAVGMEPVPQMGMCIVMEFVDGKTLKEKLADDGMNKAEAELLLTELLDAVEYIHSLGIVHRDLKPSNMILTNSGNHLKLIDFGVADSTGHAVLKQSAGTTGYMAPEQASTIVSDPRNDIYSIGIIMQELPLNGVYKAVSNRCLMPINQRYQSISELRSDLQKRQLRRRRWKYLLTALLALAIIVPLTILAWKAQNPDQPANNKEFIRQIDSLRHQLAHQKEENRRQQQTYEQSQELMSKNIEQNIMAMMSMSDSIRMLNSENKRLMDETHKLQRAQDEALRALHREMERTKVNQHIDTLTRWVYRWPDLGERIMSANNFIYDYVNRLPSTFNDYERAHIREVMLNDWKNWQDKAMRLSVPKGIKR